MWRLRSQVLPHGWPGLKDVRTDRSAPPPVLPPWNHRCSAPRRRPLDPDDTYEPDAARTLQGHSLTVAAFTPHSQRNRFQEGPAEEGSQELHTPVDFAWPAFTLSHLIVARFTGKWLRSFRKTWSRNGSLSTIWAFCHDKRNYFEGWCVNNGYVQTFAMITWWSQ